MPIQPKPQPLEQRAHTDPDDSRIIRMQQALLMARKALIRWDNIALSQEAMAAINDVLKQ